MKAVIANSMLLDECREVLGLEGKHRQGIVQACDWHVGPQLGHLPYQLMRRYPNHDVSRFILSLKILKISEETDLAIGKLLKLPIPSKSKSQQQQNRQKNLSCHSIYQRIKAYLILCFKTKC